MAQTPPSQQIIIAESEEQAARARRWFPKLEARYINGGDWREVEGRRVVCLAPWLAEIAVAYASEVKTVPEEIPPGMEDSEIPGWVRRMAVLRTEPAAAPATPPPAGAIPASAGAAPDENPTEDTEPPTIALGTSTHADEQIPLESYADAPETAPERPVWVNEPQDWPDAADLWGDPKLPGVEEKHLPPSIFPYLSDQSAMKGADINQSALNALVVLAGALHNGHGIRPKAGELDYIERPVLWGACVGASSVKKGPALAIAKGPIEDIDHEMRKAVAKAMEQRREDLAEYEHALAAWRKEKGPKGEKPAMPPGAELPRLLIDNFTMESLHHTLQSNPRGKITITADELSQLFGGLNAYAASGVDKDRPALLRLYESKSYIVDRVADHKANLPPVFIKSWAACICGAIQPKVLNRFDRRQGISEDGMLQRFLLVRVSGPYVGEEREEDLEARAQYADIVQRLVAYIPPQEPCMFDDAANEVRKHFVRWLYAKMKEVYGESDSAASALGKLEGTFSRLCLVYHAIECAAARAPEVTHLVSLDTALRVREFCQQVIVPHLLSIHGGMGGESPVLVAARIVAAMLLAHTPRKLNSTLAFRYCRGWRNLPERVKADSFRMLEDAGWVRAMNRNSYHVNPRIAELFPDLREQERKRRAETQGSRAAKGKREAGS